MCRCGGGEGLGLEVWREGKTAAKVELAAHAAALQGRRQGHLQGARRAVGAELGAGPAPAQPVPGGMCPVSAVTLPTLPPLSSQAAQPRMRDRK